MSSQAFPLRIGPNAGGHVVHLVYSPGAGTEDSLPTGKRHGRATGGGRPARFDLSIRNHFNPTRLSV
jgi:hypothetical protein